MGGRRQALECGRARYLPSLIALLSLFVQPPSHLQSVLHRIPVRWHLQLPLSGRPRHNHNGGAVNMRD